MLNTIVDVPFEKNWRKEWIFYLIELRQTEDVSTNRGVKAASLFTVLLAAFFLFIAFAFSQHISDLRSFSANFVALGDTDAEQGQGPSREALLVDNSQVRVAQVQRPQPVKWAGGSDDASGFAFAAPLPVPAKAPRSAVFWPLNRFHANLIAKSHRARAPPVLSVLILT